MTGYFEIKIVTNFEAEPYSIDDGKASGSCFVILGCEIIVKIADFASGSIMGKTDLTQNNCAIEIFNQTRLI